MIGDALKIRRQATLHKRIIRIPHGQGFVHRQRLAQMPDRSGAVAIFLERLRNPAVAVAEIGPINHAHRVLRRQGRKNGERLAVMLARDVESLHLYQQIADVCLYFAQDAARHRLAGVFRQLRLRQREHPAVILQRPGQIACLPQLNAEVHAADSGQAVAL